MTDSNETPASTVPSSARLSEPSLHVRSLHFEGMVNARDLGGLPLIDGSGVVDCGRLVRSASPQLLTEVGAQQMYDYGVRTVVDLRTGGEQRAEGYGPLGRFYEDGRITHLDAPLLSDSSWATDPVGTTAALDDPARHYVKYLANGPTVARIAGAVADTAAAGGATLLHCAFGKDRTGVIAAVLLDAVGTTHDAIVSDYHATAEHVATLIERMRGSRSYFRDLGTPDPVAIAPQPQGIAGLLRWLDQQYGGAAGYLAGHGAGADVLVALRRHLRYRRVDARLA